MYAHNILFLPFVFIASCESKHVVGSFNIKTSCSIAYSTALSQLEIEFSFYLVF